MWTWMRRARGMTTARLGRIFERVYSADELEVAMRAAYRAGAEFGATFRAQDETEEAVGLVLVRAVTNGPGFVRRALDALRAEWIDEAPGGPVEAAGRRDAA